MALQFIDGFDHYFTTNDVGFTGNQAATLQKWDSAFFGEMSPKSSTGRFSGKAMQVRGSGGSGWIQKNVKFAKDEMVVGFAFLPKTGGTHTTRMGFRLSDANNVKMELQMATGAVSVIVNDVTTVATAPSSTLVAGVWQYMELKVKIHSTLGTVEVRRGSVAIASASAINTGTTGVTITSIRLEATDNLQLDHVDDLYLLDVTGTSNNDFLGDVRVDTLYPKADNNNNDFTLFDDGTQSYSPITENFVAVQNKGDVTIGRDHNYVESGSVGASEDYNMDDLADLSLTPTTILGVQVVNNAKKTDTGAISYQDEMVIAGTAFNDGSTVVSTGGDYHMSTFISDTDPSDSATWTAAKVDAVGSGFSITFKET